MTVYVHIITSDGADARAPTTSESLASSPDVIIIIIIAVTVQLI